MVNAASHCYHDSHDGDDGRHGDGSYDHDNLYHNDQPFVDKMNYFVILNVADFDY
jgi:hypothetical protein